MGRVKLHLVRYMGTYTILMFVSFLLWQAARMPRGSFKRRGFCLGGSFCGGCGGHPWRLLPISLLNSPLWRIRCIARLRAFASASRVVMAGCIKRMERSTATRLRFPSTRGLAKSPC